MLVCVCKGVSDRRIHEEIRQGRGSLGAIQQGCQAGTDCGACVRQIRKMLSNGSAEAREQKQR
jgi:bacterioferritin-associated ferredoxin